MAAEQTRNDVREVTFVTPRGQLDIRLTRNDLNEMCNAARTLKARYFIAIDGWNICEDCPVWGVFDMKTAQHGAPHPGAWSIDDPVKTFTAPTNDAAVMWALAKERL